MKVNRIVLILFGLFVLILLISNPSKMSHTVAVENKAELIFGQETIDSLKSSFKSGIENFIGEAGLQEVERLFGPNATDMAASFIQSLEPMVTRRNYYLFSLTVVKIDGLEQTIGFGILGSVHLFV